MGARSLRGAEAVVELQRRAGNRAVLRLVAPRSVTWKEGKRDKVLNQALPHTVPDTPHDFGTTFGIINAETFPYRGDVAKAVAEPTLAVTEQDDKTATVTVTKEPENTASYLMELPSKPPWPAGTFAKEYIAGLFRYEVPDGSESAALVARYNDDKTKIPLVAEGSPDDKGFAARVEVHENQHVRDLKAGVDRFLRPWDSAVAAARQRPFVASSTAAAKQEFYASVGGTPAEIGTKIGDDFRDTGNAFHSTTAGGRPSIDRLQERGWLSKTAYFRWKHP